MKYETLVLISAMFPEIISRREERVKKIQEEIRENSHNEKRHGGDIFILDSEHLYLSERLEDAKKEVDMANRAYEDFLSHDWR